MRIRKRGRNRCIHKKLTRAGCRRLAAPRNRYSLRRARIRLRKMRRR